VKPPGIVYSTDAKVSRRQDRRHFPADSHPAITIPLQATTTAKPETSDYLLSCAVGRQAILKNTASSSDQPDD